MATASEVAEAVRNLAGISEHTNSLHCLKMLDLRSLEKYIKKHSMRHLECRCNAVLRLKVKLIWDIKHKKFCSKLYHIWPSAKMYSAGGQVFLIY